MSIRWLWKFLYIGWQILAFGNNHYARYTGNSSHGFDDVRKAMVNFLLPASAPLFYGASNAIALCVYPSCVTGLPFGLRRE